MKLCKNCKWYKIDGYCVSPNNFVRRVNPVDGTRERSYHYAINHRNISYIAAIIFNACGYRGRWYEQQD